jgi:hypothetical protein
VQGVANGLVEPGFGHFLLHYWRGGPWPPGAFDGWEYRKTWNHLWYLPYVWVYTMLLIVLLPALESSVGQRALAVCRKLRGAALLTLPALPLLAWYLLLAARYPTTHALFNDWYAHAGYVTVFLYGYVLGTDRGLWNELSRLRKHALWLAVISFALHYVIDQVGNWVDVSWLPIPAYHTARFLGTALRFVYAWATIATVLGYGHQYLNRPFRWLPYAREAVFPWYVLHQSVLLALAFWLIPLRLGPVLEPMLILVGMVAGCALLHECVIRRITWLRPLFGL